MMIEQPPLPPPLYNRAVDADSTHLLLHLHLAPHGRETALSVLSASLFRTKKEFKKHFVLDPFGRFYGSRFPDQVFSRL
jgi:hypothetical protein